MAATKRFFKLAGQILGLLLIGYFAFYMIFDKVEPNYTVKRLGYKTYSVMTGSMEPVFNVGDLIVVVKHDFNDLKEGDIVTFLDTNNNVVTHNFVRYEEITYTYSTGEVITEKIIRTKPESDSDGNLTDSVDYWKINEARYIGKFSFKIPKVGGAVMFLQSWAGIVSIVSLIGFIYISATIVDVVKKNKQAKDSEEIVALGPSDQIDIQKEDEEEK